MIPINGSNSSGINPNKYVLKNVFNTVTNDLSEQINNNKLSIEDIKNKVDSTNDPYEWLAVDVSSEYTEEYNMKRCFNKYGDVFLIRSTTETTIGDLTIHECEVKTDYGPNIQYTFISDYVYLPAWIRDKDNDKIIYHVVNCTFVLNQETVNCSCKKLEFGEGWNNIIVKVSDTIEYVKINSDCNAVDISNNSALKDINLNDCYKLTGVHINNNPNIKNKCFLMRCTPTTFSTNNNNNTFLDTSQNWFSSDGLWTCKFIAGWHAQDINLYDRFNNCLRARINDASNDNGFYKQDSTDTDIKIMTDYFKFPSTITFSNDLYNANRTVHIPGVQINVYADETFETKNMTSNARILDFSNGIISVMWDNDNLVEKMIVSPLLTELEIKNNTVLSSINLVDCDKLTNLTIQNCPNITQIVLQHRPTTLNIDNSISLIVLDEINENVISNTSSINVVSSSVTTLNTKVSSNTTSITSLNTRVTTLENKPTVTQTLFGPRYTTTPSNLTDLTADFEIHDNYTNNDWHISKTECYYKGGYNSTIPKLLFPPCLKGYITQNLTLSATKSGSDMLYNLDIDLSNCCTRNLEFNGVTVSASIVLPEFFLYYAFTTGNDACNFSLNNAHLSAQICELKLNGQYMQFNASGSSCNKLGDLTKIQLILTQCHKSRIEPITYNGQSSNIFNVVKAWNL